MDSMTESSQNDYALNWNRPGTKTEQKAVAAYRNTGHFAYLL
jgi:hypothetical protein